MVDEVLVDFDSERFGLAVQGLAGLAESHQVILFTCHPEVIDLARSFNPDTAVYSLNDGVINREA